MIRKVLILLIYLLFIAIGLELTCRAFWRLNYGVSFFKPKGIVCLFYPELIPYLQEKKNLDPDSLNLLVLGASAMTDAYGRIPHAVGAQASSALGRDVQIHNLSRASHGTKDSEIKYRLLKDYSFDLVLVYHGVNESRANNVPDDMFRDDYGHSSWYTLLNAFDRHPEHPWLVFPFTLEYLLEEFAEKLGWRRYAPILSQPAEEWMRFGKKVKTKSSFKRHVSYILRTAKQRGEPVFLLTYSYYLPDGYSRKRFDARELGYAQPGKFRPFPVELWGKAEHVAAAIEQHNEALRELSRENPEVNFFDMANFIPKAGEYFIDVCHFSMRGAALFSLASAKLIVEKLQPNP